MQFDRDACSQTCEMTYRNRWKQLFRVSFREEVARVHASGDQPNLNILTVVYATDFSPYTENAGTHAKLLAPYFWASLVVAKSAASAAQSACLHRPEWQSPAPWHSAFAVVSTQAEHSDRGF